MILKLYSIKDDLIGFSHPIVVQSEPVILRQLKNTLSIPDSPIKDIKDKSLFYLGEYDDQTALLKSDLKFVCRLTDISLESGDDKRGE